MWFSSCSARKFLLLLSILRFLQRVSEQNAFIPEIAFRVSCWSLVGSPTPCFPEYKVGKDKEFCTADLERVLRAPPWEKWSDHPIVS